ncbi:Integrase catalytic region [Clostridium sp. DL-VIII]|nr:Integrase catalytic region [Clostridium sp. DL-VIII]
MDYPNNSTKSRKNKHLNFEERMLSQLHLKDGFSPYKIEKELKSPINTILNEIRRGTTTQIIQGKYVEVYFADTGEAIASGRFKRSQMICTKTLYNHIDIGLLDVKNTDLPMKLRRNTKPTRIKNHKKKLGSSISDHPLEINTRNEFGHWEIDTVIGQKSNNDNVLLTIVERKTRYAMVIDIVSKTAESVTDALNRVRSLFGNQFSQVFKTITDDNGVNDRT